MDDLSQWAWGHKVEDGGKLFGNRLVLVAPAGSKVTVEIAPGFDLAGLLGDGRLAMPNTETLPAGRYGKQALAALGVWDQVAEQIAQTESMRDAMTLVSAGKATLGIVYHTDAIANPGIRIVDTFPEETHAPITYEAAETMEFADLMPPASSTSSKQARPRTSLRPKDLPFWRRYAKTDRVVR